MLVQPVSICISRLKSRPIGFVAELCRNDLIFVIGGRIVFKFKFVEIVLGILGRSCPCGKGLVFFVVFFVLGFFISFDHRRNTVKYGVISLSLFVFGKIKSEIFGKFSVVAALGSFFVFRFGYTGVIKCVGRSDAAFDVVVNSSDEIPFEGIGSDVVLVCDVVIGKTDFGLLNYNRALDKTFQYGGISLRNRVTVTRNVVIAVRHISR